MKRVLWPGILYLLVGAIIAVNVVLLVVALRHSGPAAPPAAKEVAP